MSESRTNRNISGFGSWLAAKIHQQRMNQTEFAQRVGVAHGTVSRWINGRIPEAALIERIADVLVLDYDVVATKAGYRPRELLNVDPDSPTARLAPLIEQIDWASRPGRLEEVEAEYRFMIESDRKRKRRE